MLHFLRCLPGSKWLRRSVLWADDLAAVWPSNPPAAFGPAELQAMEEIRELSSAGLFVPENIFEREDIARAMIAELDSLGLSDPVSEPWRDGSPAVGSVQPVDASQVQVHDPSMYVHPGKLPKAVEAALREQNLIAPSPAGQGYNLTSPEILDALLQGLNSGGLSA